MSRGTLYVGNLPENITGREVEDLFYEYGRIVDIDLSNLPSYCFVMFEDSRDAQDAIRCRDGCNFDGNRLRVELARGGHAQRLSPTDRYGNRGRPRNREVPFKRPKRNREVSFKRPKYRVLVTGLPPSASWQDLKDHMQQAGDVWYSQVFRDSNGTTGVADYTNYDEMKYAIRSLDHSEFKNAFSRRAYIRVKEYKHKSKRTSSASPSPSPSPNCGCRRSRSRSRSRSRISPSRNSNCSSTSRSNSLIHGSPSRSMDNIRSPGNGSQRVLRSRSRSPSGSYSRYLALKSERRDY